MKKVLLEESNDPLRYFITLQGCRVTIKFQQ